eukprot:gb/GFBE01069403.1/.p1 GENE.gb/GFBE01069403.1/~~gb/GFBE01069403.1/.p1  ORF type:complete len:379 (+),score=94.67 gb/GFBE01069403.1/:1-1137(+)
MAVIFGDSNGVTQFSYLEYQALMFFLAICMCLALVMVELGMKRFALLPMLFPGVFSIREKRFFFFDIEVRDVAVGKALRWEATMLTRATTCVVLSYLWEFCVFQTTTQVGTEFPSSQCNKGMDCFASELHFLTFFNRGHEPVDCSSTPTDFAQKVVVSCISFVSPSATLWLMHLAIAHSQVQMTLKAFGILVWSCGQSKCVHRAVLAAAIISTAIFIGLFFGGVMTRFVSSWLAFVICFSLPLFFQIVWKSGSILQQLWVEESKRAQESIEANLSLALKDFARRTGSDDECTASSDRTSRRKANSKKSRFGLGKAKETILKLPTMLKRQRASSTNSGNEEAALSPALTPSVSPSNADAQAKLNSESAAEVADTSRPAV